MENSLRNYNLSTLGLGTWALGGAWEYSWGEQDESISKDTVLKSLELGVNWIDTAPIYGAGLAEKIIGKCLKDWKEKIFISTKCGLIVSNEPNDSSSLVETKLFSSSIISECEGSLKRLQVEQIDLYQIHWPGNLDGNQEALEALLKLKSQGKVKHIGLSNFSRKQVNSLKPYLKEIDSIQFKANLISQSDLDINLKTASSNELISFLYSPLENGILTDKFSKNWIKSLDKKDWRLKKAHFFKDKHLKDVTQYTKNLKAFASKLELSLSDLALEWLKKVSPSSLIIIGARSTAQAAENFSKIEQLSNTMLSDSELEEINKYYIMFKNSLKENK